MEERETITVTRDELFNLKNHCEKQVGLAQAMKRLENNPDFKEVFIEHYLKENASRLVGLLSDSSLNMSDERDRNREEIKERMIGIARFQEFVRYLYNIADQAVKTLEDIEQAESENHNTFTEV